MQAIALDSPEDVESLLEQGADLDICRLLEAFYLAFEFQVENLAKAKRLSAAEADHVSKD